MHSPITPDKRNDARDTAVVLFKWTLLRGGAEKQLLLLYSYLTRNNVKVLILTHKADMKLVSEYDAGENLVLCTGFWAAVKALPKDSGSKSWILHAWDYKSSMYGFLISKLRGIKFIDGSVRSAPSALLHNYQQTKLKYQLFHRLGTPIVSNTRAGLEAFGLPVGDNTFVVYNGIVLKDIPPSQTADSRFKYRVGMMANMRWKKDFATFIKAGCTLLAQLPEIGFYLIGDGNDRQKYADQITQCAYPENFVIAGNVSEPLALINSMDVCVLCNNFSGEGMSNSIMEYMQCRKPVIATRMGGNPELVDDGQTGYLIAEGDHLALADRIQELLMNRSRAQEMGERAYSKLGNDFSVERMAIDYLTIYKSVRGLDSK